MKKWMVVLAVMLIVNGMTYAHEYSELALEVAIDIKPHTCPNWLNVKSKGLLAVAILGTEDLDVTTIDPASIFLEGVPAIRSDCNDVTSPAEPCVCEEYTGPDGFDDLIVKFEAEDILEALGEVNDDDELELTLTGVLNDETPIEGKDCVLIRDKAKRYRRVEK